MTKIAPTKAGQESGVTETVRDRILNTARELFYREGARAVGVDTVVAQSGVAKTSLYRWFPSKDALIAAVLEAEARDRWRGWDRNIERGGTDPREQLRSQFTGIARYVSSPHFRGCPFMNVTVEFPDTEHPARKVAAEVAAELRRRVEGLVARIDGVRNPQELTDQLILLIDGALALGQCMGKDFPQQHLMNAAEALLESQLRRG